MAVPLVAGLLAGLWALIKVSAPAVIFFILTSLGVGVATYVGMDALLGTLEGHIVSSFGQLPGEMANILGIAGVDEAVKIIISAYTTRMALAGFVNGARSRFHLKNPTS